MKGTVLGGRAKPEDWDVETTIGVGAENQPVLTLKHTGPPKVAVRPEYALMLGQRLISEALEARFTAQLYAKLIADGQTDAEAKQFIAAAQELG